MFEEAGIKLAYLDCCCCGSEKIRSVSHRSFKVLNRTTETLCNPRLAAGAGCTPLHPQWQGNKLSKLHKMLDDWSIYNSRSCLNFWFKVLVLVNHDQNTTFYYKLLKSTSSSIYILSISPYKTTINRKTAGKKKSHYKKQTADWNVFCTFVTFSTTQPRISKVKEKIKNSLVRPNEKKS